MLANLEETYPGFACHLFAISGVSGGSYGGAVFAGLMADQIETSGYRCDSGETGSDPVLLDPVRRILGEDFLAPALAGMFYPDFLQRFLPLTGKLALPVDRSQDLSQAIAFLGAMFTPSDLPLSYEVSLVLNYRNLCFLMAALTVFFLPAEFSGINVLIDKKDPIPIVAGILMILLLLPYCAALIVGGFNTTFIYYRF